MKILDPSSATLTLSEVHKFLQNKPAQTPTKKLGAYEPVSLRGYDTIKKDFDLYLTRSAPHIPLLPPPETFIARLLGRFKDAGIVLTKAEILTLINLGVGVKRPAATQTQANGTEIVQESVEIKNEDGTIAEADDRDDYTLLTLVVEEAESRFSDEQLNEILAILRDEMPLSTSRAQSLLRVRANGSVTEDREISVPMDSPVSSPEAEGVATEMADAVGIEDEAAEDDALLHEAGPQRKTGEGDIDGED
jgi:hypothetical protein